jgi:hypothetical protein
MSLDVPSLTDFNFTVSNQLKQARATDPCQLYGRRNADRYRGRFDCLERGRLIRPFLHLPTLRIFPRNSRSNLLVRSAEERARAFSCPAYDSVEKQMGGGTYDTPGAMIRPQINLQAPPTIGDSRTFFHLAASSNAPDSA